MQILSIFKATVYTITEKMPRLQHPEEHATNCAVALHLHSEKHNMWYKKIKIRCPLADIAWCESVNENGNFFFSGQFGLRRR
jgi:hypothetical protein